MVKAEGAANGKAVLTTAYWNEASNAIYGLLRNGRTVAVSTEWTDRAENAELTDGG